MDDIGQKLLRKFTTAKELPKNNFIVDASDTDLKLVDEKTSTVDNEQLIYLNKSPDYCTKDARLGSFGTTGR